MKKTIVIEIETRNSGEDTGSSASQACQKTVRTVSVDGVPYYMDTVLPGNENSDPTPIDAMCDFVEGKKPKAKSINVNIERLYDTLSIVNYEKTPLNLNEIKESVENIFKIALKQISETE